VTQIALAIGLAGVSFLLAVIWGPPLLRVLMHFNIGESIRVEGPERHFTKLGTPTMGGIMIVIPVTVVTLLMNAATLLGFTVTGRSILLPLGVMLVFAILGMIDDWEGIRGVRRGVGMRARPKVLIQWILAFIIVIGLVNYLKVPQMYIPGLKKSADLGFWYIPIAMILIVGYSNAMNLTDGLDGLAGLISATAFITYGAISLVQGQIFLARFCFILAGATFGFLWFNVHPAELFMGDTGSLALGATLAVVALMTGHWILLPIIAIIPTSVTLSVILQVAYFRLTGGRRIFKMTPIHHHFELSGWSETQVVQRFWLIGLLGAMIGIALAIT
jgi:phospho-N-acetylmuramoyl-pentapeptide-transferase